MDTPLQRRRVIQHREIITKMSPTFVDRTLASATIVSSYATSTSAGYEASWLGTKEVTDDTREREIR